MEDQNVEYDSVVAFRVAVSDEEDGEFFVADDVMEVGRPAAGSSIGIVPADVPIGVTGTPSWTSEHCVTSDHRVESDHRLDSDYRVIVASAAGRKDTDIRAESDMSTASCTGTSSTESLGFLSSVSRRILPSLFGQQPGRAVSAPIVASTSCSTSNMRLTEARASRAASSAAVALHSADTPCPP